VSNTRFIINLPDVYLGQSSTFGAVFGLTKLADNFVPDEDDAGITVSEGLKTGKLVRVRLSYKDGTKFKSARVVCPTARLEAALQSASTRKYKGKDIISAGIPRRRRLR
jgi:hypothetical protein